MADGEEPSAAELAARRRRPVVRERSYVQLPPQVVTQAWERLEHAIDEYLCGDRERTHLVEDKRLISTLLLQAMQPAPPAPPTTEEDTDSTGA